MFGAAGVAVGLIEDAWATLFLAEVAMDGGSAESWVAGGLVSDAVGFDLTLGPAFAV